jgi:sulfur-oxidizing protein SoxX
MHGMKTTLIGLSAMLCLLAGTAQAQVKPSWGAGADDVSFAAMIKSGFRDVGSVKTDRLVQDETQAFCSDPKAVVDPANAKKAEALEATNLTTVKYPADGKFLGDWKAGERVAQSGRGLTWTDPATIANGGNCYNCHQFSPAEISFGTIGPSLLNYGKLMGNTEDVLRRAWAKIYNSKSVNACSNMPRAGHMGILKEKDMQDLMALLFDPESPVNK